METVETKSIFASKFFWLGVAQIVFGIAGLITGKLQTTEAMAAIGSGLATIKLRFATQAPVSITGGTRFKK